MHGHINCIQHRASGTTMGIMRRERTCWTSPTEIAIEPHQLLFYPKQLPSIRDDGSIGGAPTCISKLLFQGPDDIAQIVHVVGQQAVQGLPCIQGSGFRV